MMDQDHRTRGQGSAVTIEAQEGQPFGFASGWNHVLVSCGFYRIFKEYATPPSASDTMSLLTRSADSNNI